MTRDVLNLRRLVYFITLAEELHFALAATRLNIAQPALSQQIVKLEDELGVRLLDRTKRCVRLTDAGSALLVDARVLVAQSEQIACRVGRISRGESGRLRVGFVASGAYDLLPWVIRRFRVRCPDVVLELDECGLEVPFERLASGSLDLAIVRGPLRRPGFRVETVLHEPLMAVVPDGHRLANGRTVQLSAFTSESFVLFPRYRAPDFHDAITGLCHDAGFVPNVVHEAAEWQVLVSLVAAGLGVTIAPASVRFMPRLGVVYLRIRSCPAVAQLDVVYSRPQVSASAETFARIAHDVGSEKRA